MKNPPDCFVSADLIEEIACHLRALKSSFDNYFSIGMISTGDWITRPFIIKFIEVDDDDPGKDELIEMQSSAGLRHRFEVETPRKFGGSLIEGYPQLSQRAFNVNVPFVTTYPCELRFSALVTMKTKARSRLFPEDDMRVSLSTT